MLKDKHGRELNYLRLAVTDKCNLRCRYCMPEEGISFLPQKDILSKEEIIRLCRIFSSEGVTKIRLTGGEPFVRPDMMEILREIRPLFRSVNITTNATLISGYIEQLIDLKIGTINISLDSLHRFLLCHYQEIYVRSGLVHCFEVLRGRYSCKTECSYHARDQ